VSQPITPTGVLVPKIEPGSPEWLSRMSASKIPALLGLSPWESRFSLWHRMRGNIGDGANDQTRRGHYLEGGVRAWFCDQRPDLLIADTGTWVHRDRDWQTATPDALGTDPDGNVACVEIKTAGSADEWGPDGSDEIPAYYRPQVIWQLDTLGLTTCHIAVLLPFLEFRAYTVHYNEDDAAFMRHAAQDFLDDLAADRQPGIDAHTATYDTVRQLHPDISGEAVDIPPELVESYRTACREHDQWKAQKQQCVSQILNTMGIAKYAYSNGERIAMRVAGRNGQPPFLRPCKTPTPIPGDAA
jgi:putative phage-type endonuclease